ncbi:MAG: hypothetical protein CSA32_04870 [Desulfobulbus propionicus]|nr:MAG: hypothetical protein CSA32_04870 [Desulfobulbus propionicus]
MGKATSVKELVIILGKRLRPKKSGQKKERRKVLKQSIYLFETVLLCKENLFVEFAQNYKELR